MQSAKVLSLVNQVLYLIFLTSLVCSFRAINSISIALIFLAGLVKNKLESKPLIHQNCKNWFPIGCLLLYLIQVIALFYTTDTREGWNAVRLSSGLLFVPLAVCSSDYINAGTRKRLLTGFCLVLSIAALYCLFIAAIHFLQTGDSTIFFYHSLVSPFKQHAVYFAILVFIALVFLVESTLNFSYILGQYPHYLLVVFLSVFLFLLASKLIILLYILYLLYISILLLKKRMRSLAILAFISLFVLSILILIVRNPVSNRFYDILDGNLQVVRQDKFSPGDYFNGLQFRLLQWKFTGEIVSEKLNWLYGVSPGDAQTLLDQKYISMGMYTGEPGKGRGYLGYNTHNQFLQSLLESGIIGLVFLLVMCLAMVRMAWIKKSRALGLIVAILLAWLFTESVLETQFGIAIFTFFPIFFYLD